MYVTGSFFLLMIQKLQVQLFPAALPTIPTKQNLLIISYHCVFLLCFFKTNLYILVLSFQFHHSWSYHILSLMQFLYHSCGANVELKAVSNSEYSSLYVFLLETIFFNSDVCKGIIFIPVTDFE